MAADPQRTAAPAQRELECIIPHVSERDAILDTVRMPKVIPVQVGKDVRNVSGFVALAVLKVLAQHGGDDAHAFPGQKLMCDKLGLDRSTVSKATVALEASGLIRIRRQKLSGVKSGNHYYLDWDRIARQTHPELFAWKVERPAPSGPKDTSKHNTPRREISPPICETNAASGTTNAASGTTNVASGTTNVASGSTKPSINQKETKNKPHGPSGVGFIDGRVVERPPDETDIDRRLGELTGNGFTGLRTTDLRQFAIVEAMYRRSVEVQGCRSTPRDRLLAHAYARYCWSSGRLKSPAAAFRTAMLGSRTRPPSVDGKWRSYIDQASEIAADEAIKERERPADLRARTSNLEQPDVLESMRLDASRLRAAAFVAESAGRLGQAARINQTADELERRAEDIESRLAHTEAC